MGVVIPGGGFSEDRASGAKILNGSLRFNSGSSHYLSRTPASAGNQKTWTFSAWIKRSTLGTNQGIFNPTVGGDGSNESQISFLSDNKIWIYDSGTLRGELRTTQLFRDASAWFHLVVVLDTPQVTPANRLKLYINGSQVTSFSHETYPSQDTTWGWNAIARHDIGRYAYGGTQLFNGYLTEINFIDGQALDSSYFGFTDPLTGTWRPKKYTGTYGTNGFYLPMDNQNDFEIDKSGRGNNWTKNNFSGTFSNPDVVPDSPSGISYSTTPTSGITTTSSVTKPNNYCTLNPLDVTSGTFSNGNVNYALNAGRGARGTIFMSTGKWYFEAVITAGTNPGYAIFGIQRNSGSLGSYSGSTQIPDGYGYLGVSGSKYTGTTSASYGDTFTTNDTIGVAYDLNAGKVWFSKNGTWQASGDPATGAGAAFTSITAGEYAPYVSNQTTSNNDHTGVTNFGQRPFKYTPPTGFLPICTANLPRPTEAAVRPDKYFKTVLWTGTGVTNRISGVGFKPDLVWIKKRNVSEQHELQDSVRGATQRLTPDVNNSETTVAGSISSFNSDGFTVVDAGSTNENTYTYVGWSWKAGGPIGVGRSFMINDVGYATAADAGMNTGTITPTSASVNTDAGISIVTYTGNGSSSSGVTIGHGLGVKPDFIITKKRSSGTTDYGWSCWHKDIGGNYGIWLDLSNARNTSMWGGYTNISATLFSPPDLLYGNENGQTYVNYLWYGVPGFSKFGTYTGNGNADGVYVHLGFRPAVVIVKDLAANNWNIVDNTRDPYNYAYTNILFPDLPAEENTGANKYWDFLSNGLKARGISSGMNGLSRNYIYAAWAEAPTQNLFGGQANAR